MEKEAIIPYIEGEPKIMTAPVEPGATNTKITGMQNESSVEGEGKAFFDILFHARFPDGSGTAKLIINVEGQNDPDPGYHIETRGVFYAARLISAQKHTEFEKSDYDSICKVYSIWLLLDPPEGVGNAMALYTIRKEDLIPGIQDNKEAYDKLAIVLVSLKEDEESNNPFIGFMNTIVSTQKSVEEKKALLEGKYGVHVTRELEGRLKSMNYGEMLLKRGEKRGMEKGMEKGYVKGRIATLFIDCGMNPDQIAEKVGKSVEYVTQVLTEERLLPEPL